MAKYAKRRKHRVGTHRRRRRVGAMSMSASSPLIRFGAIAAGYFLADTINTPINGVLPASLKAKTNAQTIVGAVQGGLGGLLWFKGKGSMLKTLAGGILLGASIPRFTATVKTITGYGMVPVVGRMNGYGRVPVIGNGNGYTGGYTPSQNLAGALNGMNSGYAVPRPPGKQVLGCTDGSGSGVNCDSRN